MVYKTKLVVGVPSLTPIPIDIYLSSYIYSPGYIWAQGSKFFSFMHNVYIDIIKKKSYGEKCTRLRSYFNSVNFKKKSMVWHLHWGSHSPRTWTLLTWPTYNMNREINWQQHDVMDWLTCNQTIVFFLSQSQNSRLVRADF